MNNPVNIIYFCIQNPMKVKNDIIKNEKFENLKNFINHIIKKEKFEEPNIYQGNIHLFLTHPFYRNNERILKELYKLYEENKINLGIFYETKIAENDFNFYKNVYFFIEKKLECEIENFNCLENFGFVNKRNKIDFLEKDLNNDLKKENVEKEKNKDLENDDLVKEKNDFLEKDLNQNLEKNISIKEKIYKLIEEKFLIQKKCNKNCNCFLISHLIQGIYFMAKIALQKCYNQNEILKFLKSKRIDLNKINNNYYFTHSDLKRLIVTEETKFMGIDFRKKEIHYVKFDDKPVHLQTLSFLESRVFKNL